MKPGKGNKPFRILFLIPPFYSHFLPMMTLARSFAEEGAEVIAGTGEAFQEQVIKAGLTFAPVTISRNANTGIAAETRQGEEEQRRLKAFFEATHQGAEETLYIQSLHRREDMLSDPGGLLVQIQELDQQIQPDLWMVDQLSYGATLAMKCLQLPFISVCPPHPFSIPDEKDLPGVPVRWPENYQPNPVKLALLEASAAETRHTFTDVFNSTLAEFGQPATVKNAFSETSPLAVIYMYPPPPAESHTFPASARRAEHAGKKSPAAIYAGYCFKPSPLSREWEQKLAGFRKRTPRILLSFGSFLSHRADLLEKYQRWIREILPESGILVAAGDSEKSLGRLKDCQTLVEGFIPQTSLYPLMDLVIHHGGCNTFTECLYFGKPMIILPFASDQFHIAADGEEMGVAAVLNPQRVNREELGQALWKMLSPAAQEASAHWRQVVRMRGPEYACKEVMRLLKEEKR